MNYANKIVSISEINFNLDTLQKFEGENDTIRSENVRKIRDSIGNLTLLDEVKVSTFYKSETNTYVYNNAIEYNEEIEEKTKEIIEGMKVNEVTLENALNDNVFMEFVTTMTIWSKILTSIYVLLKVSATTCLKGIDEVNKLTETKDKEIKKLTKLLEETSNLLFSMDNVEDINFER